MRKRASQQVNPNTVRNSCIALIEALATNANLKDDQVIPSLGKLKAGTILAMFCVIRFWALDSFVRLSGIGSVSNWDKQFEELGLQLPKVSKPDLSNLALQTGDGVSSLFLATAFDALRMIAIAIEKKLEQRPIGKKYVRFRDTVSEQSLDEVLKAISPSPSYYHIKNEPSEDRRSDIFTAFLDFIDKQKKAPIENWADFPHTVLADHRVAPHPEWDNRAQAFLSREVEDTLRNDLPILGGKVENAPLRVRTALRDKYSSRFPQISFKTTGETVTPRNLDLEAITPDKLHELGGQLNPEILFDARQSKTKKVELVDRIKKSDPQLYWALMKNRTANRVNKTKAAKDIGITRQALDKRIKKIRDKSQG
jgi:hypothetical protein